MEVVSFKFCTRFPSSNLKIGSLIKGPCLPFLPDLLVIPKFAHANDIKDRLRGKALDDRFTFKDRHFFPIHLLLHHVDDDPAFVFQDLLPILFMGMLTDGFDGLICLEGVVTGSIDQRGRRVIVERQ